MKKGKSELYNQLYTMKSLYFVLAITFCTSCKTTSVREEITRENIAIKKIEQHPFLSDHKKQLVVIDNTGKEIDDLKMYVDSGEGCDSNLFETDVSFVLIDCNGQWFSIGKKTGRINKEPWEWKKPLPGVYVGTFVSKRGKDFYEINRISDISLESVYKFKDPND